MNKLVLLTTAVASLALSYGTLSAAPAQAKASSKPVPVTVVSPTHLPREYENALVKLKLTIDADGVPHNVKPAEYLPSDVAARLVTAVSQWRFSPARINGQAVPTSAILPLKLQEADGA